MVCRLTDAVDTGNKRQSGGSNGYEYATPEDAPQKIVQRFSHVLALLTGLNWLTNYVSPIVPVRFEM